jgi:hypothetical protein
MTFDLAQSRLPSKARRIMHRTRGQAHGPVTRLMSPSDFGEILKPIVFLDLIDVASKSLSGFGLHPHSGIATVTHLFEGNVRYEDTTGASGLLPEGVSNGSKQATVPGMAAEAANPAVYGASNCGSRFRRNTSLGRCRASIRDPRTSRRMVPLEFCSAPMARQPAHSRPRPRSTIWRCV